MNNWTAFLTVAGVFAVGMFCFIYFGLKHLGPVDDD